MDVVVSVEVTLEYSPTFSFSYLAINYSTLWIGTLYVSSSLPSSFVSILAPASVMCCLSFASTA